MEEYRLQFPELEREVRGFPYSYLDSAATTLKPKAVLEVLENFYRHDYATIHRGAYMLSEKATHDYEAVRSKVVSFIGAGKNEEIIFTRGTTESINLVANTYGEKFLKSGDVILVSEMEHHSNIVPWQMLCERKGCVLKVIPMDDRGVLNLDVYDKLLEDGAQMVTFNFVSNALGTINPVKELVTKAKSAGAITLVDGAQSAAHLPTDVKDLEVDFYVFSGHKIYGPTGVGVLYGRHELLETMPPWQGGGDMIDQVSFEKTTYAPPPARFEAGTPAIAEVIGLGAAIDWLLSIGLEKIDQHENSLCQYAIKRMSEVSGLNFIGTAPHRAGAISFTLKGVHPHDIATILDGEGVAVRAGHHCAQPVMKHFNIPATARASLGLYNNESDIDRLVKALGTVNEIFG